MIYHAILITCAVIESAFVLWLVYVLLRWRFE
jgi:hypothetical protein